MSNLVAKSDVTKFSRRTLLAAQGVAFGSLIVPDSLLAALNAATPAMPRLDTWEQVKRQFDLAPDWLHFSGFFVIRIRDAARRHQ